VVRPDGESAVFVTSSWSRTALHQDDYDNVLLHLQGTKSVVLIDPVWIATHSDLLGSLFTQPGSHAALYHHHHHHPASASAEGHRVQQLPRFEIELAPGDLLYIPRGWLHDVESRTPTVSAALRFEVGNSLLTCE